MTMRPEPYEHLVADALFDGLDRLEAEAEERGVDDGRARVRVGALAPARRRRRLRPVAARPPRAGARGARVPLTPDERDRIGSFFP